MAYVLRTLRHYSNPQHMVCISLYTSKVFALMMIQRAMTHDEELYPDPDEFKPERFLNSNGNINDILAFGFGRRCRIAWFRVRRIRADLCGRVCVGRHLADSFL
jgi:hypothetical protein